MPLYKHRKRGKLYEVIAEGASLQCASDPEIEHMFDGEVFTVYRSLDTGAVYVRKTEEFNDGRFVAVPEAE